MPLAATASDAWRCAPRRPSSASRADAQMGHQALDDQQLLALLDGQVGLIVGPLDEGRDANSAEAEELAAGVSPEQLQLGFVALAVLVLAVAADCILGRLVDVGSSWHGVVVC